MAPSSAAEARKRMGKRLLSSRFHSSFTILTVRKGFFCPVFRLFFEAAMEFQYSKSGGKKPNSELEKPLDVGKDFGADLLSRPRGVNMDEFSTLKALEYLSDSDEIGSSFEEEIFPLPAVDPGKTFARV